MSLRTLAYLRNISYSKHNIGPHRAFVFDKLGLRMG